MPGQVGSWPERCTNGLIRRRAARLAVSQRVATPTPSWWRRRPLWDGLKRSEWVVDSVTRVLTEAARSGRHVSLAGQWLLDNAYVVRRQIGDVRRNFSRSLYDVLPLLQGGTHGGEPRIYELALEFVAHSEAQVNLPELTEFLRAFQRVQPLTMAELWAMPLTLRLALIESVAYVALETDRRHAEHDRADFWANRLLDAARRDPDHLLFMLGELARDVPAPSPFFVDGLFSQLEGEALALDPIQAWLERKVGAPVADVIQREQLRQATDQVMIANAIGSLRLLAELDWREVFEQVSPVHEALCQDPSGVYATMDFATRDHYRHAVEEIAHPVRGAGITATAETAVAQAAVRAAAEAAPDTLERHVGYFLLGAGRRDLEAERGSVIPRRVRVRRRIRRRPAATYVGGIALATAALIASFVALTPTLTNDSGSGGALLLILAALAVIPLSEVATQLVNYAVTRLLPPDVLPKLSFGDGIPDAWRTLVVVPMLLTRRDVERELERLEVRFLGNRDPNLHFALLADFTDAPQQDMPGDEALIAAAVDGTEQLNRAYGTRQFSLFYRQRLWSDTEQVWMGWERKRGKLEELNQLLVQLSAPDADSPPSALTHVGGVALDDLADTRFVITLDSDTQLPHDSARRLVETLAHPLNRPRLAPDGHTVSGGYAIIQPRVSTSLPSATATRFSRVFTDPVGTDPYTRTVSDVYQDLAGEGSYHGKGIYDLQAFHAVLGGRFPDALLLSHDLVEGAHVRVGLATDVEVFDLFPSNYPAYASREHRWIRGDWQIAQWCTPWVPTAAGRLTRNRISMLNRWKIFDNLRRSLVPPAAVALLAAGWLLFPAAAWLSTSLVALMLLLPLVLGLLTWLLSQPGVALRPWRGTQGWKEQRPAWIRVAFQAAFLPHQSLVALDAIWRVFHRRALSRRSLLQWQTSGAAQTSGAGARRLEWQVGAVTLCAASLAVAVVAASASSLPAALPFIALWLLAPAGLVWLSGRSPAHGLDPLPAADRAFLGRLARQTWRYFDDFVGPQSSWLPPDNYQAALQVEVAARTSPTNVGLWLLSTLAAHDFGYLTLDQMIERGAATFETLQRLERCEGHLLNWYDTGTLQPLSPRYVSTVDSGNLLASLWAFGQGYAQKLSQPVLGPQSLYGLRNTVAALQEALVKAPPTAVTAARARQVVGRLSALTESPLDDVADIVARLRQAVVSAGELESLLEPVTAGYWATQIRRQIQAHLDIADRYLAWIGPGVAAPSLRALASGGDGNEQEGLADAVSRARWLAGEVLARAEDVMAQAEQIAGEMNMQFLFNAGRKLFSIGYSVDERRLDRSHYDLLASESRLASLVAIARGDVPVEHWLALGRTFGRTGGRAVLLSWTGTMFEYLMPLLLTRTYENSLLDAACRAAVATQIEDGARRAVPWGVSEAAYSAVDAHRIYQYQAFGVPGLGLKRGLEDDLVVAPYATALALAIAPHAAVRNLRTLERAGLAGDYGSFESIDYTPRRLGAGESRVVVYTYMAHHQGMTLVALDNALHHNVMPARFHADPRIRATESLLFERVPLAPAVAGAASREAARGRVSAGAAAEAGRRYSGVDSRVPRVQLLANPSYALMVTSAGGGYSRWRGLDVTRWSADTTRDSGGSFIYLRDLDDGTLWSAAHHPVGRPATRYSAYLSPARVEFDRQDVGIGTRTEIAVSSEDDVEVRRVTLANLSDRVRRVEITSYAELALAAHAADRAHPAFSKMFVQTQALPGAAGAPPALLAWRSPRGQHDPAIWAAHVLALPPAIGDARPPPGVQYETNRARFLGRGRSAQRPVALEGDLSNAAGHVLDPIFSLRCRVALEPGERFQLAFVTGAAEDRVGVLTLAEKYRDLRAVDRALELAWSQAQLVQRQMRVTVDDQERFRRLASHVLFPSPALRATERQLRKNRLGQARLWAHGISGDLPIVLVQIGDSSDLELVRESLLAHAQWRMQGLKADLVILDEEAVGYEQPLRDTLQRLVQVSGLVTGVDQPGGIFLRREAHLPAEDVDLLLATACVVLVAARGSLAQQLAALAERPKLPAPLGPGLRLREDPSTPLAFMELPYFNGYGGFTPDGREYAIYLGPGTHTPAPWINIMANPHFGALVSEAGQGFVWYGNSQTNRLLPWSNDPVVDPCADAIYIRDETSGVFWTPTAAPVRELDAYRARHGQGYTVFEHNSHAIEQELLVCVPVDDDGGVPVRLQRLRLRNRSSRPRRLSVIAYAEWVLGASREETHTHVVTSWDAEANALLAVNHYHPQWSGRVAFAGASRSVTSFTADRTEFLVRNGSAGRPAARAARALSGQVGAGLGPCAALQVNVELKPGEETEVVFVLGQAADAAQA
ncbi:MAG: glucoamylase family protein, partial [Chloroflexota bacterium]